MEITQTRRGDIVIFQIAGRLDSNSSADFEAAVFGAIESGEKKVAIDFGGLDYISSAGLRVILKAAKDLKRRNGGLVLCSMQDYVKEVFEISGFDTFLPITGSVDDGILAFGKLVSP
ncbi:MAG: STAS domain-containing protein [Thermodesulfobacteriota bacterium]